MTETCACEVLTHVLSHSARLPDHVCYSTLQSAVSRWASQFPTTAGESDATVAIPLDLGRYALWSWAKPFPVPVFPKSQIVLVIRQWVEHGDAETSRKLLKEFRRTHPMAMQRVEKMFSRYRDQGPLDDSILPEDELEDIRSYLVGSGLPATPGTAAYFLGQACPGHPLVRNMIGPTRGVLVTSIALTPSPWVTVAGSVVDEMLHQLSWTAPWGNQELTRKAQQVAAGHENWWRDVPLRGLPEGFLLQRLPKVNLTKQNTPEPDDIALEKDLEEHLNASRTLDEVCLRQQSRVQQAIGKSLTPTEKARMTRQVKDRLRHRRRSQQ